MVSDIAVSAVGLRFNYRGRQVCHHRCCVSFDFEVVLPRAKPLRLATPLVMRFGVIPRSTTCGREMRCSALFTIIILFSKNFINTIFTKILYLKPCKCFDFF